MQRDGWFRLPVASTAVLLVLAGCSSMSKNECLTVDWRTVGYEDGVAGYSGDRIGQHRKACAKYGVTTDLELYQQGRERGLREFSPMAKVQLARRLGVAISDRFEVPDTDSAA